MPDADHVARRDRAVVEYGCDLHRGHKRYRRDGLYLHVRALPRLHRHRRSGQLTDWLTGESDALQNPQASTDGVAALVRDMAVALDFSRDSAWCSCRYFYHSEDCNGCPADGSGQPCHRVLFDDIRRRCETLGIDLKAGDR